ncbi:hypothetical protein LN456_19630 [Xanthomonas vesicatoria]|nr:hypothetical protein [Xanthomonas vesicatoria]
MLATDDHGEVLVLRNPLHARNAAQTGHSNANDRWHCHAVVIATVLLSSHR